MLQVVRRCLYGLALACLMVLIGMASVFGLWYLRGGRLYSVQTNSMAPVFSAGDAVLVNSKSNKQALKVGDVVTYRSQQGAAQLISHRIVRINLAHTRFTVRGDNLAAPDPPLASDQIVGQVWGVAPGLGRLLSWAHRPIGLLSLIYLPALLVIVYELVRTFRAVSSPVYRLRA